MRLEEINLTSEASQLMAQLMRQIKNVISQEEAEKYLQMAHEFCPYSKATQGNT